MFDNPTDNHTDIEVPLYYELRFTKLKKLEYITKYNENFVSVMQTYKYIL